MTDINKALAETLNQGATKATVISTSDIVLSEKFYDICASNSCGKFGRCWVCPPDSGDIFTLMDKVRSYSNGILYQTIVDIEDSFDIEGMSEGAKLHAQLSQKIRKNVEPLLGDDTCTFPAADATFAPSAPKLITSLAVIPIWRFCRWNAAELMCITQPNPPISNTSTDKTP